MSFELALEKDFYNSIEELKDLKLIAYTSLSNWGNTKVKVALFDGEKIIQRAFGDYSFLNTPKGSKAFTQFQIMNSENMGKVWDYILNNISQFPSYQGAIQTLYSQRSANVKEMLIARGRVSKGRKIIIKGLYPNKQYVRVYGKDSETGENIKTYLKNLDLLDADAKVTNHQIVTQASDYIIHPNNINLLPLREYNLNELRKMV